MSQVKAHRVDRVSTGCNPLDMMFGKTEYNGSTTYGIPRGKVILISGSKGAGKSRLCLGMAGCMSNSGEQVLFFEGEVAKEEFKEWARPFSINENNCYVSESNDIEDEMAQTKEVKPSIVIVDSLNMIKGIRQPTEVIKIMESYKNIAKDMNIAVILIGFLSKDGSTKGNNDIEYLVDVVCHVKPISKKAIPVNKLSQYKGVFYIEIPDKNRVGETGNWVCFKHEKGDIKLVSSSFINGIYSNTGNRQ